MPDGKADAFKPITRRCGPSFAKKAVSMICTILVAFFLLISADLVPPQLRTHKTAFNKTPSSSNGRSGRKRSMNEPDVIIYRRTKKTGSSSMVAALLRATKPLGFYVVPLIRAPAAQQDVLQAEAIRQPPRKLIFLEHNSLTRSHAPGRNVIIIDTLRDGFKQITSQCRYTLNVKGCGKDMINCLRGDDAKQQILYRWAGADGETADNYIDIPLSSEHPALSTTALRTLVPNITLDIERYNVAGSACNRTDELMEVYNQVYGRLEEQVRILYLRLLNRAGYYASGFDQISANATLPQLLDAAEETERRKYEDILNRMAGTRAVSSEHKMMFRYDQYRHWDWKDGKLVWVETT